MNLLAVACSLALVPALLVAGCKSASPTADRAAVEQTLRALDADWAKNAGAHDLDGTMAFYSDDAVLLPPDEPLASSKDAIRKSWAATLDAMSTIGWEVKTIDVAESGELAYITGAWHGTVKLPNGPPAPAAGKLLEVWKKQADGKWKCVADTFNSDAPMFPVPPAK